MPALLPDQLAAELGRDIVAGRLQPGQVVRLEELEEAHDVSRTVAREAVKSLAQLGLVAVRRRVGTVVADPSLWNDLAPLVVRWRLDGPGRLEQLNMLAELRMGVEPVAARLGANRATPAQLAALEGAVTGMTQTACIPDLEAYLAHDVVFHRTVLTSSHNPLFATLGGIVEEVLSGRTHHHLMPSNPNPTAIRWHREVVDAMAAHDGPRAEDVMRMIVAEAQTATEAMAAAEA